MAKLFLPRHGRTHCRGGSDPIPCLHDMVIGEAYKESTQIISSGGFTVITGWDAYTIQDAAVIDQDAAGLLVNEEGWYMLSGMATWSSQPTNGHISIQITSEVYGFVEGRDQVFSQAAESRFVNRMMEVLWIDAGKTLKLYAEHFSGTNRTINLASIKALKLPLDAAAPFYVP